MAYRSDCLTIERLWCAPCGISIDVGNGRTIMLNPSTRYGNSACVIMATPLIRCTGVPSDALHNFIFDESYGKSNSVLLTAIRELVEALDKAVHDKVPDLEASFTVTMRTPHRDLGITFDSLIKEDPTLVVEVAELKSVAINAIEYAYSQNYSLTTSVPDHIVYPYDWFVPEDIPYVIGIIDGELHIIGRKVNADQSVIDNFNEGLAIQLLRQFYYHLTS